MSEKKEFKETMIRHIERCKECSYCIIHCPKEALSFSGVYNQKGYNTVVTDHDKCVRCGICYTVCPDYVFEKVENQYV